MTEAKAARPRKLAMDLLARREHSLAELRTKLAARDFDADEIERTVAELAREGLASDDRFVEEFVAARVRRGKGPVRIRAELARRGIDADLIRISLETCGADWEQRAREVREKKYGAGRPRDFAERARQARFLEQRGFTGEQIRRVLEHDD